MKKNFLFIVVISLTITILVLISSVLNIVSLKNNYLDTIANNNAILVSGVASRLEYSIRYGKSLSNYYDMEDNFSMMKNICDYVSSVYVVDTSGNILYEQDYIGEIVNRSYVFRENINSLPYLEDSFLFWVENGVNQNILLPIKDKDGSIVAGLGMVYDNSYLDSSIRPFVNSLIKFVVISIILGLLIFLFLFRFIKHDFVFKRLLAFIIPVIIFSSSFCGIASFNIYKSAYTDLVNTTADTLFLKIQRDIESVVIHGIDYSELVGLDEYFNDILVNASQIENISMVEPSDVKIRNTVQYSLSDDFSINITTSESYIRKKLQEIIIDIFSYIIISILISAEIVIFVLAVLTNLNEMISIKKKIIKTTDNDILPIGIVRGLFFFFAMFQYMSLAFVPIVMAEIYRPIFGLPYEIVMSIPLTAQLLMSIFSSWICGLLISSRGWRPVAVFGMTFMVFGALLSSISKSPMLFIAAQIVLGFGLGCAKTSFDIFGIVVSSTNRLDEYTTNTNSSLIVGMSCSAALGAVTASVMGYAGAFVAMSIFGIFVIALIFIFSSNIIHKHTDDSEQSDLGHKHRLDIGFVFYLLLSVIPYYFVSMYLDYFFPVFADSNGMSTANIGHVFLLYGIATSYVGTWLCNRISKNVKPVILMSSVLFSLGAFLGIFSVYPVIIMAVSFVLIIGIADGIMPTSQYKYIYSLDISKRLGISKVIGIEGAFISMIRGVSPIIFGFVMLYGVRGLLISSVAIMILAATFFFVGRR